MFTPVPMQRVRIIALKEDQASVVSLLHSLGAVQLEPAEKGSFFREASLPDYSRRLADESFRFEGLASALPPFLVNEQMSVGDTSDVLSKAQEIKIDDRVRNLKNRLEEIDVDLNRDTAYIRALEKVRGFDRDLAALGATTVLAGFYTIAKESYDDFRREIQDVSKDAMVRTYGEGNGDLTMLVIIPKGSQDATRPILEKYKATKLDLPLNLGSPNSAITKLNEEIRSENERKAKLEHELKKISSEYYGRILAIREALIIESQRVEALGRVGQSQSVFVIEGWVPVTRLSELENKIQMLTQNKAVVERVKSDLEPPTLMQNSKKLNYFEFFVRFFSLPKEEEIDPTLTFAFVFPIFFGMMLGDVGYGLVILLIALWLRSIGAGKANTKWLPKPIRSFGKSLMPKRVMGTLGRVLIPSAIVGMIFGVIVNAYFGFVLPFYHPLLDLVKSPQIYLIITLFVGLAHITLGYVYGIYIGLRTHHMEHVYSRIGWLGFLWSGVVAIGATLSIVLNAPWPIYIQYAGLAGLVVFGAIIARYEKGRFVMEIPTLISHVVSYGRILGVLLASLLLGVIASSAVANSIGGPVGGLITTIIVFVLVTILNVVLGIFEPAIQGARLHYVEFYSKFFEGNGKRFQPFVERRAYTKREQQD